VEIMRASLTSPILFSALTLGIAAAAACSSMSGDGATGANLEIEYDSTLNIAEIDIDATPDGKSALPKATAMVPVDLLPPGARMLAVRIEVDPALDGSMISLSLHAHDSAGKVVGTGTGSFFVARSHIIDARVRIMVPGGQQEMPSNPMMSMTPMTPCTDCPTVRVHEVELAAPQSTASASFVDIPGGRLAFTPTSSSEQWIVFVSGLLSSSDPGESTAQMRILINDTEVDLFGHQTRGATDNGAGFLSFERVPGGSSPQTITAQFRALTGTTTVDGLRLLAILIPSSADLQFAALNDLSELTGSEMELAALAFTPRSAGDYFVFAKVDQRENPGTSTSQAWLEDPSGARHPEDNRGARFSNGRSSWQPMFAATKAALGSDSATIRLRGTSSALTADDWWNEAYPFRRKVTVSAAAGVDAPYAVALTIDHASLVAAHRALPDGSDLRVAKRAAGGWTQLDRVLDDESRWNDPSTKIWFAIDTAIAVNGNDDSYYIYYGNQLAAAGPADDLKVFAFHDDFSGQTLDVTARWNVASGAPQLANGTLIVGPNAGLAAQPALAFGADTIWEAKLSLSDPAPNLVYWAAATSGSAVPDDGISFSTDALSAHHAVDRISASDLAVTAPTSMHRYAFAREGVTTIRYTVDGGEVATHEGLATQASLSPLLLAQSTGVATYDWVRVRSWVNPEPQSVVGAEESLGGGAPSQWRYRKLMAFRADAFDGVGYASRGELQTTAAAGFHSTAMVAIPAPSAATDYVIIQNQRIGGPSSDTARKVGELRAGGRPILATSHKINKDGSAAQGYHHNAAAAHAIHTGDAFVVENGVRSPDGIDVSAADSTIIVLRYPALP
jgi:uncharacterized protein DUF2341